MGHPAPAIRSLQWIEPRPTPLRFSPPSLHDIALARVLVLVLYLMLVLLLVLALVLVLALYLALVRGSLRRLG